MSALMGPLADAIIWILRLADLSCGCVMNSSERSIQRWHKSLNFLRQSWISLDLPGSCTMLWNSATVFLDISGNAGKRGKLWDFYNVVGYGKINFSLGINSRRTRALGLQGDGRWQIYIRWYPIVWQKEGHVWISSQYRRTLMCLLAIHLLLLTHESRPSSVSWESTAVLLLPCNRIACGWTRADSCACASSMPS